VVELEKIKAAVDEGIFADGTPIPLMLTILPAATLGLAAALVPTLLARSVR